MSLKEELEDLIEEHSELAEVYKSDKFWKEYCLGQVIHYQNVYKKVFGHFYPIGRLEVPDNLIFQNLK